MAEYSKRDSEYARQIVNQLLGDEKAALDLENDLVVYDLQTDAADFSQDLELLRDIGADMPAIRVAEHLIPMSLSSLGGSQWFGRPSGRTMGVRWWRHSPFFYEWAHDVFRWIRLGESTAYGLEVISREEARSTFATLATNFLATRIAGVRALGSREPGQPAPPLLNMMQKAGGSTVATPGCLFSVSSNSPGLRAFWSGAYRIDEHYFGHPTTATSVLQSGDYVFGVDGGAYGNDIQWDKKAVVSLPGIPQVHLNY